MQHNTADVVAVAILALAASFDSVYGRWTDQYVLRSERDRWNH